MVKIVSIRCRRHKKRFNVEECWLDTCGWLCPRCYEKLSESEKRKYAPAGNEAPEVRPAEKGKPTILPTKYINTKCNNKSKKLSFEEKIAKINPVDKNIPPKGRSNTVKMLCIRCGKEKDVLRSYFYTEHLFCPDCNWSMEEDDKRHFRKIALVHLPDIYKDAERRYLKAVDEERRIESAKQKRTASSSSIVGDFLDKKKQKKEEENINTICTIHTGFSQKLKDLMPKYRIHCLKCGEDVPCHGFWIEKSKVLCPSCASTMDDYQITAFNRLHDNDKCKVMKNEKTKKSSFSFNSSFNDEDPVSFGGGCSDSFIRRATEEELKQAVKQGKLSRVRFKIEMKRRKNPEWYDDCPEVEERCFGKL